MTDAEPDFHRTSCSRSSSRATARSRTTRAAPVVARTDDPARRDRSTRRRTLARWLAALGDLPADAGRDVAGYDGAARRRREALPGATRSRAGRRDRRRDGARARGAGRARACGRSSSRSSGCAGSRARARSRRVRERPRLRAVRLRRHRPGEPPALRDGGRGRARAAHRDAGLRGRDEDASSSRRTGTCRAASSRKEILPKLRRNPGYLAAQEMEIVSGRRVLGTAPDAIARARARARAAPPASRREERARPREVPVPELARRVPARHAVAQRCSSARAATSATAASASPTPAALARWVLRDEGWDDARVDRGAPARRAEKVGAAAAARSPS